MSLCQYVVSVDVIPMVTVSMSNISMDNTILDEWSKASIAVISSEYIPGSNADAFCRRPSESTMNKHV
ncbi:MAG: hypothetical protein ACTSWA_02245 [Candidatus Thorarchaeota archaeon]